MPMKQRLHLLVRLFGGAILLLACLCDPTEAFQPSSRGSQRVLPSSIQSSASSPSSLLAGAGDEQGTTSNIDATSRRTLLKWMPRAVVLGSLATILPVTSPAPVSAAPPISIIAEELGYYPIQSSKTGKTVYVPKRVQRASTDQAVKLAEKLTAAGVTMYGAFWCPHCSNQKEMFGQTAWSKVTYVECAGQGYNGSPGTCAAAKVDGYPTWVFADGTQVSGERPLADLAKQVGFKGFRADMETKLPTSVGSAACK
jgi:hypothetical protein